MSRNIFRIFIKVDQDKLIIFPGATIFIIKHDKIVPNSNSTFYRLPEISLKTLKTIIFLHIVNIPKSDKSTVTRAKTDNPMLDFDVTKAIFQ